MPFRTVLAACIFLACSLNTRAQGCSQCRDTVAQTDAAQQRAYREAIGLMLAGVAGIGTAAVLVVRRFGR